MSDKRWTIYVCPSCSTVTDYDRPTGCGACEDGPMTVPVVVMPVAPVIPTRAEYDAALARVRAVHRCEGEGCDWCIVYTLAALGLDEPPTEGLARNPLYPTIVDELGVQGVRDWAAAARRVVPPSEPPKACPGCHGTGTATWADCVCCDCGGSGIDGGTP